MIDLNSRWLSDVLWEQYGSCYVGASFSFTYCSQRVAPVGRQDRACGGPQIRAYLGFGGRQPQRAQRCQEDLGCQILSVGCGADPRENGAVDPCQLSR